MDLIDTGDIAADLNLQRDECEIDFSTGREIGYAEGWNAAIAAMKEAP